MLSETHSSIDSMVRTPAEMLMERNSCTLRLRRFCNSCSKFSCDGLKYVSRHKIYCGRALVFYAAFFTILLIIFFLIFLPFLSFKDYDNVFTAYSQSGYFNHYPGLQFEPLTRFTSPLIWYMKQNPEGNAKFSDYIEVISEFLSDYRNPDLESFSLCEGGDSRNNREKPCFFNLSELGPCANPNYGYDQDKPCVYFKLNKVPSWLPEYYTFSNLPSKMPEALVKVIKEYYNNSETNVYDAVWLSCRGINPLDLQHLGKITYYPSYQGFQSKYFPFMGRKKYMSPLVAIQIENTDANYLLSLRCTSWARNSGMKDTKNNFIDVQLIIINGTIIDQE